MAAFNFSSYLEKITKTLLRDKKRNPAFLKVARVACLMVLLVLLWAAYGQNFKAYVGNLGVKDYFGEYYNEIWHYAQPSDKQFAMPAAKLFEEAIAFEGTAGEAEEKYGILARYCGYTDWNLMLITTSKEAGCLWFSYTNNAAKNVLVRFTIEADGTVTDILEHP